ncbi:hypothetical protein GGG16DRAFT_19441, partial [Schizophyllum commune]
PNMSTGGSPAPHGGAPQPPQRLPYSGLLSIDTDFDFAGWRTPPAPVPSVMPLTFRHADNIAIEKHNDISIRQTLHYEAQVVNDDVGAPLKPLFAYTEDEITFLLDDTLGTLQADLPSFPYFLRTELAARKKARDTAEKEKTERERAEKEARKVKPVETTLGLLQFKDTPDALSDPTATIQFPEIYKVHVACGLTLPLALLSNNTLRTAMNQDNIKTRVHSKHNRKDATVVNEKETLRILHLPADEHLNLTEHDECILNYVALMESIAPSSVVTGPLTNMTYEFRALVCWFLSVRDRVHRYATWRPVEKMFMKRLFDNEVKFNPTAAREAINLEYHKIDLEETNHPTFESSGGTFHRAYTLPNARTDHAQPSFNRGRDYDDRRQRFERRD